MFLLTRMVCIYFVFNNWRYTDDSFYTDLNASGQQLLGGLGKDGGSSQQQHQN